MAKFRQPPNSAAEAIIVSKTITANGTYNASSDNADGYDPVTVNVPVKTIVSKSITANGTYNASADSADGYNPITVNVPTPLVPLSNFKTFAYSDIQNVEYVSDIIDDILGQAILFNDSQGTYLSYLDGGATITLYERLSSDGEYAVVDPTNYTVEWRGASRGNYYYIVNYVPNKYVYDLKYVIYNAYRVTGNLITGIL